MKMLDRKFNLWVIRREQEKITTSGDTKGIENEKGGYKIVSVFYTNNLLIAHRVLRTCQPGF